ncbi:oxygenase MpaB family protein [Sphingomonas immobilis]|uniref:Oxygenase MpaB family protein n=1 Tax=Sphingomonas immobilis TaxID=3063997 RepID=A0ABT9A1F1_9SPHN|nr:oxygenase MpaB family protein [Sphingomonas sp. CA1-15]MDO7843643.1 oxygenase MpaB family protein [Sphingomonas sp. CA1-15]
MPGTRTNPLRRLLVGRVQGVLNNRASGETPVVRSAHALYPPDSVIWRVHGDVTTMMIGGVTALLLQMLHPAALAGVWDHSTFRSDMLGRLRRTARFIAVTTYGERAAAEAAIEKVRSVHLGVNGVLPDGTPYAASDPKLLAWVHVCEVIGFLDAWIRYGERGMSLADQDTYVAQAGLVATALGCDPVPQTRAEAEALVAAFRPALTANARTREVARMVLTQPAPSLGFAPVQRMLMHAAVDLMPPWAKDLHGLHPSAIEVPVVRAGTMAIAQSLQWAFAGRATPRD